MFEPTDLIALVPLGLAVMELVLLAAFNPTYFTVGIPLFRKTLPIEVTTQQTPTAHEVEDLLGKSIAVPFRFRLVGPGRIAFREAILGGGFLRFHYPPLMHAVVCFDPLERSLTVTGYANLFICGLFGFMLTDAGSSRDIEVLVFAALFVGLCYTIQAIRFSSVASAAAKAWTQLQQRRSAA